MTSSSFLANIRNSTMRRVKGFDILNEVEFPRHKSISVQRLFEDPSPVIIAEVKRSSPTSTHLGLQHDPVETSVAYANEGASIISVLTEPDFFSGSLQNLIQIRKSLPAQPLLMKDFILDYRQIDIGKKCGADVILLIVKFLDPTLLGELFEYAKSLNLEVLVEVQSRTEMNLACEIGANLIGVNNRDLRTLQIDPRTSMQFRKENLPQGTYLISESGITTSGQIRQLQHYGYQGFLIGSHLMKSSNPGLALRQLRQELQ